MSTPGFETERAAEFPRYLMYDVNNVCNARCPFCPQSSIAIADDFSPTQLDWSIFEKTIEEAAQYPVELVRFTGDGEPLLHPRMTDMIGYARDLGFAKINLTTNGSLLKGDRLSKLLASPPHVIDISLDAHTPETYAIYRVGLNFEDTVANVHELLDRRDPGETKVVLSIISHPGIEDEVKDFQDYWIGRVDEVAVRNLHTNLGAIDVDNSEPLPPRWPCPHLWQRLVVDFRGHIRFCPIDWHDKSFVGEADSMTLQEAWRGPKLEELRERHLTDNYKQCGVCEKCTDWSTTRWNDSWIDMMKQPSLSNA